MIKPELEKGNCLIFIILFKWKNPTAKILIGWNSQSRVPSFSALIDGKYVFYRRKDRAQSKYFFNGKIVIINKTQNGKP
jgi:hypothetical protein